MRCSAEVSATTRGFLDERSARWTQLFIAQLRGLIAGRDQGLDTRGAWPGRAEAAAGPMCVLRLSCALETVDGFS